MDSRLSDDIETMSSRQVANYLGVTQNTLQKWRSRNMGPKYVKFSGANSAAIRYLKADVIRFRELHTVHTTGESSLD